MRLILNTRGFTMLEILAASVIGGVLAGGTMMAMVLSTKIARDAVTTAEATVYAAQTIERYRNQIACDGVWFDNATDCSPIGDPQLPTALTNDPLPPVTNPPTSSLTDFGATRQYQVNTFDCNFDTFIDGRDCLAVTVVLTWNPPS